MCGIVMIRLRKEPEYYLKKYGTAFYAHTKMQLIMEKMINRGQDGAGVVNIKLNPTPGKRYFSRSRAVGPKSVTEVFEHVHSRFQDVAKHSPEKLKDAAWLKENEAFTGEVWLGHLRYGTYGGASVEHCHPFLRQNNWMTRCITLAGNFNLTNVDELYDLLLNLGQHPKEKSDTVTIMEKIGHFLDLENERLDSEYKKQGYNNREISNLIAENLDIQRILQNSAQDWDGGYAMAGIFGHGDSFVVRDPNGIRPCYYFADDEVICIASERAPIQTAFQLQRAQVTELPPGHAIIIRKDGSFAEHLVRKPGKNQRCSFERIYFSRGSDADIYQERYSLGRLLAPRIAKSVDPSQAVFGYIPNTAEVCFYGMVKGLEEFTDQRNAEEIMKLAQSGKLTQEAMLEVMNKNRITYGKPLIKDTKSRTFITSDADREAMVGSVYDVTYNIIKEKVGAVVLIDDSIVRGTTLRTAVIRILSRLEPKKIVIVSSAPQIRYPDCYGIDMAKMGDFCAFQAAVGLLKDAGKEHVLQDVYKLCKAQEELPNEQVQNFVRLIYEPFTAEEISARIAKNLRPDCLPDYCEFEVIFQDLDGLREACPNNPGNWYFSGHFPTPGGNKVVNRAYIYYMEGINARAY